jgi:hypothetical protein
MTSDNFCFYLQNRLIQISQTGGQQDSDTFPLSIPCINILQWNSTLLKVKTVVSIPTFTLTWKSGSQSSNLYLNVIHFFNASVSRHLWQLRMIVFLELVSNTSCSIVKCKSS